MGQDPGRNAPGGSEYSWGPGMHPHPMTNYDRMEFPGGPANRAADGTSLAAQVRDLQAYRRLDTTQKGETLEDMYVSKGNTDRFGAAPPLIRTKAENSPSVPIKEESWHMEREW